MTTQSPAAFFATAPTPAPTPAAVADAVKPAERTTPATIAAAVSPTDLTTAHEHFTALGQIAVIFGYSDAGHTAFTAATLTTAQRVRGDGSLAMGEMGTFSPMSGTEGRLRASDGTYVVLGQSIGAPTADAAPATRALRAYVVGADVDGGPLTIDLHETGPRAFRNSETDSLTIAAGTVAHVLSVAITVRARKDGTWYVSARIFTGGRLPLTAVEELTLAAMRAGVDPAAVVVGTIDHPNARTRKARAK